jgi:hypothetical protein
VKSHLEMTANARQEIVSKLDRLSRLLVSKKGKTDDPEVKKAITFEFFWIDTAIIALMTPERITTDEHWKSVIESKFKFFPEIPGDRGNEVGPYEPETVPQSTRRKS